MITFSFSNNKQLSFAKKIYKKKKKKITKGMYHQIFH